tara:strand:- start:2778 stop:2984 length:207 start_codon:yes stop_codon:yes gene_type:complete
MEKLNDIIKEIRRVRHQQARLSDPALTWEDRNPHPHSKAGRTKIKECRNRLKDLEALRKSLESSLEAA